MSDIPQWAIDRANALHDAELAQDWSHAWLRALAKHIAEHEEAPADPLVGAWREVFPGDFAAIAERHSNMLREALAKRGLKIVPA